MANLNLDRAHFWIHGGESEIFTIQKTDCKAALQLPQTKNFLSVSRSID